LGLIDALDGASAVALDTPVLIYYFQDQAPRVDRVAPVFERINRGNLRGIISVINFAEVLAGPLRDGQDDLAASYHDWLRRSAGIEIVPADVDVAELAAEVRAVYNIGLPDAIVVATARLAGCSHVVTNDSSMARVQEPRVLLVDSYTE